MPPKMQYLDLQYLKPCLDIYIPSYIFIFLHTYLYSLIHIYIPSYIFIFLHTYLYSFIHIYIPTYIFIFLHKYLYSFVLNLHNSAQYNANTVVYVFHRTDYCSSNPN